MNISRTFSAVIVSATLALATLSGCAVIRGQESASEYISDASITTTIKGKMVEDKTVSAGAISVETLNGVVQLSGFAKSAEEKRKAGEIAATSKGVKSVRNDIVIRP